MPRRSAGLYFRAVLLTGAVIGFTSTTRHARAGYDDLTLDLGGSTLDLRRIPKGTFTQGSPATEAVREADESSRVVTLSRAFWLGKVPVTRAQFTRFVTDARFVTEAERSRKGGFGWDGHALVQKKDFTWRTPGFAQRDDDPVVLVTFADATAFTEWASRKTGRRVRLPTEAEWEYAARAGTTTPWYGVSQEDEALELGWFKQNAHWTTHPVGRKVPNAFGLFDMTGNVFEWCRDVYAPYPAGEAIDPENAGGARGPVRRVLRGGSWLRDSKRGRSAARHKSPPGKRTAEYGFRVLVEEDGSAPTTLEPPARAPAVMAMPSAPPSAAASSFVPPPTRVSTEGNPWALVIAPFASAAASVLWVVARRRRRAAAPAVDAALPGAPAAGDVGVMGASPSAPPLPLASPKPSPADPFPSVSVPLSLPEASPSPADPFPPVPLSLPEASPSPAAPDSPVPLSSPEGSTAPAEPFARSPSAAPPPLAQAAPHMPDEMSLAEVSMRKSIAEGLLALVDAPPSAEPPREDEPRSSDDSEVEPSTEARTESPSAPVEPSRGREEEKEPSE